MLNLNVCIGSSCHLKGSYNILQTFQQLLEEEGLHEKVDLKAQFCMKQCQNGVAVSLDDQMHSVSPETARDFFRENVLPKV
ncbi:MAG: (2Fe-2S) ferredoxin domain-containing protein [Christensenellaceae bacterium]|jgi:NADH:ubiquinone oxidoreductase subunit E